MKNAKITFLNNAVTLDSNKLFNKITNTIEIIDKQDLVINVLYDNCSFSNLSMVIKNSKVTLIEEYQGNIKPLNMEIEISNDSSLFRFGLYENLETELKLVRIIKNYGYYQNVLLDVSKNSVSHEEETSLLSPLSRCDIFSAIYANNKAIKDYKTKFSHQVVHTSSDCKIFGICNDFAKMTITTDAYIKKGASNTKATQEGRIINLVDTASGIIFPDLHIDENDVEAAHSCSVGSVNLDHLYYLQTRGFSYEQAKSLLIKSYFTPIYQYLNDKELIDKVTKAIEKRIG